MNFTAIGYRLLLVFVSIRSAEVYRYLRVHASTVVQTRSSLFWDVTQRRLVANCRRFGTNYPSHLQASSIWTPRWGGWPLKVGPMGCTETLLTYCQSTLRNILEERKYLYSLIITTSLLFLSKSIFIGHDFVAGANFCFTELWQCLLRTQIEVFHSCYFDLFHKSDFIQINDLYVM